MDMYEKLSILAEAAKYDASCSSSGSGRSGGKDGIGAALPEGKFAAFGETVAHLEALRLAAPGFLGPILRCEEDAHGHVDPGLGLLLSELVPEEVEGARALHFAQTERVGGDKGA